MTDKEQPWLAIELGISPKSGTSFEKLYQRGQEQTSLVVAASAKLAHLSEPEFVWRCPIVVAEDTYVILIPIEPAPQPELAGLGGKRNRAAYLRARDAAVQEVVDITTAGAQAGAELLRTVADITDTAKDARRELRHLELTRGVDTGPARRHLMRGHPDFRATVEETMVLFAARPVRPSQQLGPPVRVLTKLVPAATATAIERCEVIEVVGGQPLEGTTAGGRKEFRFPDLEPWKRVVLAGARELGLEFWIEAVNRIGTCSLQFRPADVVDVDNWRELYAATMAVLQQSEFGGVATSANDEYASDAAPEADDDVAAG